MGVSEFVRLELGLYYLPQICTICWIKKKKNKGFIGITYADHKILKINELTQLIVCGHR